MSVQVTTTVTIPAAGGATAYDLVTLANYKADLSITVGIDDTYLSRAISKASQAISQYCNRVFAAETVQDLFDLTQPRLKFGGEAVLQTSRWPIISITSVVENTGANAVTLVRDTDYRVDVTTGLLWRLNAQSGLVTTWGASPVTVIYQGGFATIPLDLQDAATNVVKSMQFNRTRDPSLRSENILSGLYAYTLFDSTQMPGGTADQVSATLDNYRMARVA